MRADQDSFEIAVAVRALAARHEVLSITLQEVIKQLSPEQANACGEALRARVQTLNALSQAIPAVDEAVSGELAAMLAALGN